MPLIARDIVDNNRIERVMMKGEPIHYSVKDVSGEYYTVSLADRVCTCNSRNICGHYVAANFMAGNQKDFSVPTGRKVKPVGRDKKGRKAKHGTKKPIKNDEMHFGVTGTPKRTVLVNKEKSAKEAMEDNNSDEDFIASTPTKPKKTPMRKSLQASKTNESTNGDGWITPILKRRGRTPRSKKTLQKTPGEDKNCGDLTAQPAEGETGSNLLLSPVNCTNRTVSFCASSNSVLDAQPKKKLFSKDAEVSPQGRNIPSYSSYEEDTSDKHKKVSKALRMQNEWQMFTSTDGKDYGVSTGASGEAVLIVHHADDISNEMLEVAAYAASASAEIETFVESASICQKMSVATIVTNNIPKVAEAVTTISTLEESVEQCHYFEIQCVCSEPNIIPQEMVTCSLCEDKAHVECAGQVDDPSNWVCLPCSTPIAGAKWSAGEIGNTCSIDNHTTGQALYAAEHPDYLKQLASYKTMGEKVMHECITLELAGESAEAQEQWHKHVKKQRGVKKVDLPADQPDFFASPEEVIHNQIPKATSFQQVSECDNVKCPKRHQVNYVHEFNLSTETSISNQIENQTNEVRYEDCAPCMASGAESTRSVHPLTLPSRDTAPLYITFNNGSAGNDPEDLLEAPDTITIDGLEYDKGMMVVRDAPPNQIPHFTSLHKRGNFWVHYDGMIEPTEVNKRFRRSVPQDYIHPHKTATELLYWKRLPKVLINICRM